MNKDDLNTVDNDYIGANNLGKAMSPKDNKKPLFRVGKITLSSKIKYLIAGDLDFDGFVKRSIKRHEYGDYGDNDPSIDMSDMNQKSISKGSGVIFSRYAWKDHLDISTVIFVTTHISHNSVTSVKISGEN